MRYYGWQFYFSLGNSSRFVGRHSFDDPWSAKTNCPLSSGSRALVDWVWVASCHVTRYASGLLTDEEVARPMKYQTALCLTVLVGTNHMLGLVTASQIASASVLSFFRRLT